MGSFSLPHILLFALVVVLLFGAGRLSNVMGEFAKGIKAFRSGLKEEDPPPTPIVQQAPPSPPPPPADSERKVG
jgi:sec-independent protein translocase protein TatA